MHLLTGPLALDPLVPGGVQGGPVWPRLLQPWGPRALRPRRTCGGRGPCQARAALPAGPFSLRAVARPCARPGALLLSWDSRAWHIPRPGEGAGGAPQRRPHCWSGRRTLPPPHTPSAAGRPAVRVCLRRAAGGPSPLSRGPSWHGGPIQGVTGSLAWWAEAPSGPGPSKGHLCPLQHWGPGTGRTHTKGSGGRGPPLPVRRALVGHARVRGAGLLPAVGGGQSAESSLGRPVMGGGGVPCSPHVLLKTATPGVPRHGGSWAWGAAGGTEAQGLPHQGPRQQGRRRTAAEGSVVPALPWPGPHVWGLRGRVGGGRWATGLLRRPRPKERRSPGLGSPGLGSPGAFLWWGPWRVLRGCLGQVGGVVRFGAGFPGGGGAGWGLVGAGGGAPPHRGPRAAPGAARSWRRPHFSASSQSSGPGCPTARLWLRENGELWAGVSSPSPGGLLLPAVVSGPAPPFRD